VTVTQRLLEAVQAAVPAVAEVSVGILGNPATVTVRPAAQQAAAQAAIDAFDWSGAAQQQWEADRVPERRDLRADAQQALADNATFLAIASPSNAQNAAQVRRLTQQMQRVIRRLVQID
jgi:hypothetical protein